MRGGWSRRQCRLSWLNRAACPWQSSRWWSTSWEVGWVLPRTRRRSSSYNSVLEPSAIAAKSVPMRQAFQHNRIRCLICSPARLAQGQPFAGPLQAPHPRQSGWSVAMSQPSMQQAVPVIAHAAGHICPIRLIGILYRIGDRCRSGLPLTCRLCRIGDRCRSGPRYWH